jgi:hypothetical protein
MKASREALPPRLALAGSHHVGLFSVATDPPVSSGFTTAPVAGHRESFILIDVKFLPTSPSIPLHFPLASQTIASSYFLVNAATNLIPSIRIMECSMISFFP